jgi:hypothetical protein
MIVRLPFGGSHILLTIAQVHSGANGNRWKIKRAQQPKQTDIRRNIAGGQPRFEIFTNGFGQPPHCRIRLRWQLDNFHLRDSHPQDPPLSLAAHCLGLHNQQ